MYHIGFLYFKLIIYSYSKIKRRGKLNGNFENFSYLKQQTMYRFLQNGKVYG